MKAKKLLFNVLFFVLSSKAYACDVCGCSATNTTIGILPQFHKHFIGIQYNNRNFNTEHTSLGTGAKTISTENFYTMDIRGRFNLSKRIHLFVFLPFSNNLQTENNHTTSIAGIGDLSSFVNYSIVNNANASKKKWKHNLQVGGGFKLPTGNYQKRNSASELNPNLQPGTGSLDLLLDAIHTVRYKKFGLNSSFIYRINNSNPNNFQFGNRSTLATSLFYWANKKKTSILPSLGLVYENAQKDSHNEVLLPQSGGNTIFTSTGLDVYYHKIAFGINGQLPFYQDNNIIKSNARININLLYNF